LGYFLAIVNICNRFISLEKQNVEKYNQEIIALKANYKGSVANDLQQIEFNKLQQKKQRNTTKHIAEGLTFLAIILLGAFYIYKVVLQQIKASNQQQNFIMAVTHELKTPIAIAQLNIETLIKRELSTEQQQKLLQKSLVEMHRLNDLASNILVVSQIEKEGYKLHKEKYNLSEALQKLVVHLQQQNPSRIIHFNIDDNINIEGDSLLLNLTFTNLIDNALKYSPNDTSVSVQLIKESKKIIFWVKDQGMGISEIDKEKVFEKFYRVGNELTRTKKGTGLGLYLCKKIINDHKATIALKDNTPKGSIFVITFTVKNNEA
jgi:two-component system, OmpR family, sensor histidine kinase CiaH